MKKLAWVTGARGLLGNYAVRYAAAALPELEVHALTRVELDITQFAAVEAAFARETPALVIHCAALSQTRLCQQDPAFARLVNVQATAHLARLAADSQFIFLSSDLVFDGREGNYTETAQVNPLNVYAETMADAEQIVLRNPRHLVIRTSINGGISHSRRRGFNEQLRRAWEQGRVLDLFTDEYRCPMHARFTARAAWELALRGCTGLFHVAGTQRLSRWEIGQLLAQRWPELKPQIRPASAKQHQGAPRPADTSLNCAKAQAFLSFPLPHFAAWLATCPPDDF